MLKLSFYLTYVARGDMTLGIYPLFIPWSGVYTSNLLNDLEFYFGQILSVYEAKSLGKYFTPVFSFIKGQYLAQIKIQIVKQIGCVDATLAHNEFSYFLNSFMTYDTQYNNREIQYIDHNYSSDASSLWIDPMTLPCRWSRWWVALGIRVVYHPLPWHGWCWAGYSNTGGPH